QAMFGAATPAAVSQGLAEARDARARAEAELAALTGGAAAAAPAAAPAAAATSAPAALGELGTVPAPAAAVPVEPPVPAPQTTVSEPAREPVPAPAAPSAPPAPAAEAPKAPAAPRLVTDDGKELPLPADKREIIVGREDPISGIFPEIDLTPYGGETGGVSRQHARISQVDGQWTVTDLQSTNYTRVDGARIEPNVPVPIKSGARLQFGRVALVFQA
ncbi:MAG TPA: FHA domain-containing protein, partial [Roseiflexaceae bacterium]